MKALARIFVFVLAGIAINAQGIMLDSRLASSSCSLLMDGRNPQIICGSKAVAVRVYAQDDILDWIEDAQPVASFPDTSVPDDLLYREVRLILGGQSLDVVLVPAAIEARPTQIGMGTVAGKAVFGYIKSWFEKRTANAAGTAAADATKGMTRRKFMEGAGATGVAGVASKEGAIARAEAKSADNAVPLNSGENSRLPLYFNVPKNYSPGYSPKGLPVKPIPPPIRRVKPEI